MPATTSRVAALLWLCLWLIVPAHAQRKREKSTELAPAPPPAMAQTISVRPGETVPITLGIHGTRAAQVEFLIRNPPKSGKLSAIQNTGQNSAVVQYTAGREGGQDRFTYAARTSDGVSAPAMVNITIVVAPMLPPRLIAVEALDFPAVVAGQESTATLELTNQGGSVAEGELTAPDGWRVEGSAKYRLAAGKRAEFKLIFAPEKAGDFRDNAVFGPTPRRSVLLQGKATPPLEITPAALDLTTTPGSQTRTATLKIENRTAEPRQITISAGPRIIVDRVAKVPASGSVEVAVSASADDPLPVEDQLHLESAGWSADVPVHVPAIAAKVKFSGPVPDFGKVAAGDVAEAMAILENTGGMPGTASVRVDAPFEVAAAGVSIPARGTAKVPLRFRPSKAGAYSTVLIAETAGATERLPLAVEVAGAPDTTHPVGTVRPARSTPSIASGPDDSQASPTAPRTATANSLLHDLNAFNPADLTGSMGQYAREVTPRGVLLEWPSSLGSGVALAVQEREISLGADNALVTIWKPLANAKFSETNGLRQAAIETLEPDRLYVVRVTSSGKAVLTTKFVTPPSKPLIDIGWQTAVITLLLASLAGIGWWRWKRRVRSGW